MHKQTGLCHLKNLELHFHALHAMSLTQSVISQVNQPEIAIMLVPGHIWLIQSQALA